MTIEAIGLPYDRAKLHYAEVALYQEFEPDGENKILPFNATFLEREEQDEVIELEMPLKIRRITKLDGKMVYEFWRSEERGWENGGSNPFSITQQAEGVHVIEEPVKEAPKYMNGVVKNVQEEFVKVNLNDEGQEWLVKISKGLP